MTTLHIFSNRHIGAEVSNIKKGDWVYLENLLSRKRWALFFKYNHIDESTLDITYITQKEYFELKGSKMKFDIVVGNPPYLKGMWIKFLKKAVELSKSRVLMVSPDGTNSFSSRSNSLETFLKENGIQSKEVCTGSFPEVKSGKIVRYDLDINKKFNPMALIDTSPEGEITTKVITSKCSGKKITAILSSKRSKKESSAPRYQTKGKDRIKHVESITKETPVFTWIDKSNTHVIDANEYWLTNRYFGTDASSPLFEESGLIGISPNILAIKRIDGWTAEEFKKVYLTDVIRFTLTTLRQGGFDTSPRHLAQLPVIPKSKKTNKAIGNYLGLTQEEIDYIEANVK